MRFDTSNYGDDSGPGERKAAEYVADAARRGRHRGPALRVGPGPHLARGALGRVGALGRSDPLLLHGHLDVVPAAAEDWQVDPFAGEVHDGYLWGRGTVDMKDFDAMLLAVVRHRQRTGRVPERPIRLVLHRRRGGRWPLRRRSSWSSSTATSSRAAPRPSARSAASAPPCAADGST